MFMWEVRFFSGKVVYSYNKKGIYMFAVLNFLTCNLVVCVYM